MKVIFKSIIVAASAGFLLAGCGSGPKDGEYVIEGNMTETNSAKDICPYIWTSAGAQKVAETTLCQGVGLAVAGNDIYVAGNENAGYDSEYNPINIA